MQMKHLSVKEIKGMAIAAGVTQAQLDEADDNEVDYRGALLKLIEGAYDKKLTGADTTD
jgi:hypothetical protein